MASAPLSSSQTTLSPSSGAPQALQNRLNALTRRRNSVVMGRHLLRALVPGVWASAMGITLYKTHIIADAPIWLPLAALGVCALWGLRSGLSARGGTFRAARDADATLGLKDSLGSALSFVAPDSIGTSRVSPTPKTWGAKVKRVLLGQGETFQVAPHALETTLVPALVADAAGRAQSLDPRRVYSWKFDRTAKVLAVGVALLVGSLFVPDYPIFASKKELSERTAIMKSGEKLAMLSKDIRKRQDPNDAQVAELNKRLEKLGVKMSRGRMTRRAALTEIGELKQQLEKAQQQQPRSGQGQQGGMPQIPEAIKQAPMQSPTGQKVQQDLQNNKFQDAARRLEELADKLDKGQLSQKEKEQAAKDLEEVARQLRQRGGQANENAAQQLEQAAKQLQQPQQQQGQQQQGQQQQNGQNQQQQNNQQQGQQQQQGGQQGQQKQGQQGQGQQQQQGGQQGQQKQGQQGQGQQQQSQQGQGQQGQKGQQQQSGQQGQGQQQGQKNGQSQNGQQGQQQQGKQGQGQSQSQNGQSQNKQGGQQGSQSGQQGQSPNGQQGQQGGQSGQGGQQQGQGQEGQSNASGALRDMANSLRQGSGGSGGSSNLRDMMNNLREAENGSNGGSASGKGSVNPKPGYGSGDCPGGDCRGLMTPGKDLMATDPHGTVGGGAGLGPRSNAQGNNSGGGVSHQKSTRTGDHRRYEDVWSSRLPKPHSKVDRVKGKWGGSGEVEQLPTRGDGKGGQAHTPYYDVYESYKHDAEDAVGRESVPPAYKAPVKDYFESIKP